MTRTRTITKFVANLSPFSRALASGHLNRVGHQLTGFYIIENGFSSALQRTCECRKGARS